MKINTHSCGNVGKLAINNQGKTFLCANTDRTGQKLYRSVQVIKGQIKWKNLDRKEVVQLTQNSGKVRHFNGFSCNDKICIP